MVAGRRAVKLDYWVFATGIGENLRSRIAEKPVWLGGRAQSHGKRGSKDADLPFTRLAVVTKF
jgi:hypothetical protein